MTPLSKLEKNFSDQEDMSLPLDILPNNEELYIYIPESKKQASNIEKIKLTSQVFYHPSIDKERLYQAWSKFPKPKNLLNPSLFQILDNTAIFNLPKHIQNSDKIFLILHLEKTLEDYKTFIRELHYPNQELPNNITFVTLKPNNHILEKAA